MGRSLAVEILSYAVLGNHYHVVLFAPHELPSEQAALDGYAELYGARRPPATADSLDDWRRNSRDVSFFCFQLQIRFTTWFNRKRSGEKRTGTIWNGRFKSTILEGKGTNSAVWSCLKYVELNPVRAGIVADPADYRWSSWGSSCGSGVHPFAAAFESHLVRLKGCIADSWEPGELYRVFGAEMKRAIQADVERQAAYDRLVALPRTKAIEVEIRKLDRDDGGDPSIWVRTDRRVRFWSDGIAIGSRRFVEALYEKLLPDAKEKPGFASSWASENDVDSLFSMKRKKKAPKDKAPPLPSMGASPPGF